MFIPQDVLGHEILNVTSFLIMFPFRVTHLMLLLTLNTSYPIAISIKYYEESVTLKLQVRN